VKEDEFNLLKARLQAYVPHLPALLAPVPPADEAGQKNTARALAAYAVEKLFGTTTKIAAQSVTDDFGDQGIDAVFYHQADRVLCLFQSKLKLTDGFLQGDVQPFIAGVRLLLTEGDLDKFNENFKARSIELQQALDDCAEIRLILVFTGGVPTGTAKDQLKSLISDKGAVDPRLADHWVEYGPTDAFTDLLLEKAQPPVDKELVLYGDVRAEESRPAYYGVAKLADLAEWYTKDGKRILQNNIRFSLGANRTEVNKSIYATLENDPSSFFFLNNGVTLLAKEIHTKRRMSKTSRKYGLKAVSIINGAQTVATASAFYSEHPTADSSLARVMVTLIKVDGHDEFGVQVTKARNTQNPVAASAFAALDSTQETLRRAMALLGWDYFYRPEAAEGVAPAQSLRIDEISEAHALFHPNPNMPIMLKTEPARLRTYGTAEYGYLFNPAELSARRSITAAVYAREILRRLDREASHKTNSASERAIYRHGKYAIAWVLCSINHHWLNAPDIPTSAQIAELIDIPLDNLRQIALDEAKASIVLKGPLAFFRSPTDTRPYAAAVKAKFTGA
jgi:hypothetical protein